MLLVEHSSLACSFNDQFFSLPVDFMRTVFSPTEFTVCDGGMSNSSMFCLRFWCAASCTCSLVASWSFIEAHDILKSCGRHWATLVLNSAKPFLFMNQYSYEVQPVKPSTCSGGISLANHFDFSLMMVPDKHSICLTPIHYLGFELWSAWLNWLQPAVIWPFFGSVFRSAFSSCGQKLAFR